MAAQERYHREKGKRRRKWATSLTNVVYDIVEPICGACEHLERYTWGWECGMHDRSRNPSLTESPTFPETVIDLCAGAYKSFEDRMEITVWKKRTTYAIRGIEEPRDHNARFLERYGGHAGLDRSVYPSVWCADWRDDDAPVDFMYPKTETVTLLPGTWVHYVLNGPLETLVVSVLNDGADECIRRYDHRDIKAIKTYYQQQRADAGKKPDPVVEDEEGETYALADLKAALWDMKKRRDKSLLPDEMPETERVFAEFFDRAPRDIQNTIVAHARELRFLRDARSALESLRQRGEFAEEFPGSDQKFEDWYDLQSPDVRLRMETRVDELRLRRKKKALAIQRYEASSVDDGSEESLTYTRIEVARSRQDASGYNSRPRKKEGRKVRFILHNETSRIVGDLDDKPGTITLIRPERHHYGRADEERKEYNRRISRWPESTFAGLMTYKSYLAGFGVAEVTRDLKEQAACPACGARSSLTWQDIFVVEEASHLSCDLCGEEADLLLALIRMMQYPDKAKDSDDLATAWADGILDDENNDASGE